MPSTHRRRDETVLSRRRRRRCVLGIKHTGNVSVRRRVGTMTQVMRIFHNNGTNTRYRPT